MTRRSPHAWTNCGAPPAPWLRIVNPADLCHVNVPEREWIVQDWLPVGCVTANYGDGGVGKTLLAQQLMTSTSTKALWCGYAVMQCRSFGLFCEDDEAELHRRQDQICDHLGIHLSAVGDMRWISGVGEDNALATFGPDGRMHITERFEAVEKAIKAFGARLVVLDTAADLFAGNENDRHQVRRFIGQVNRLALEINGAVLLNAHPSRTGLKSGDLDGGSTAWSNSVRSRWSLARPDAEDGETQPDTADRILTRRKANYASSGDRVRIRWIRGAFATVTRDGGITGTVNRATAEAVFLEKNEAEERRIRRGREEGTHARMKRMQEEIEQLQRDRERKQALQRLYTRIEHIIAVRPPAPVVIERPPPRVLSVEQFRIELVARAEIARAKVPPEYRPRIEIANVIRDAAEHKPEEGSLGHHFQTGPPADNGGLAEPPPPIVPAFNVAAGLEPEQSCKQKVNIGFGPS